MKYTLTEETMIHEGITLHRIKYSDGQIGGWLESEKNLSQTGSAGVYHNARVFGEAKVFGDARVYDNVRVFGEAKVFGDAEVYDNVRVFGNAKVYDNAKIYDTAKVYHNAKVFGEAKVFGDARVYDDAEVCATIKHVILRGDMFARNNDSFVIIDNIGSRKDSTTFCLNKQNKMKVACGCFFGTIDEFRQAVLKTHKYNLQYRCEYLEAIQYVKKILMNPEIIEAKIADLEMRVEMLEGDL